MYKNLPHSYKQGTDKCMKEIDEYSRLANIKCMNIELKCINENYVRPGATLELGLRLGAISHTLQVHSFFWSSLSVRQFFISPKACFKKLFRCFLQNYLKTYCEVGLNNQNGQFLLRTM